MNHRNSDTALSFRLRHVLMASTALFSFPALAQEAPVDGEEEAIIVTGSRPIAESEAAALQVQKNSDSLVTVLSSDSVGRLPDQNIAQATGRLPGVAVERDQGQARYISLRGSPNYWTTLSFDGINIVSPEGRDSRFDSIPSALASQIIVSKAVTPDMPGETISGNVNIVTRSALDYDGFRISGKLGGGKVELGDRKEYEGSLTLSNVFDTNVGEIGVLLSGSYYERNMITDNFEIDWRIPSRSNAVVPANAADRDIRLGGTPIDLRPGYLNRFWARETENKLYRLTRKNWSVSGRFDFRPDSDNTVSVRTLYTIFSDDEARDNYIFDLDDRQNDLVTSTAACTTGPTSTPTTSAYADVCSGNTPFLGTVYGVDINQRSTLRAFRQSVFTSTIEGKHRFGDDWGFKWIANYTKSVDDRSVVGEAFWDSPSTRTLRPTVAYDFTNPELARVQLFTTNQLSGPTRFQAGTPVTAIDSFTKPLSRIRSLDAVDPTKAYTFKAELARDLNLFGGEGTIRAGVQYDQRTKINRERELSLNTAQATAAGISTNYQDFSLDQPFLGEIPLGYTFRYFSQDAMRAAIERARTTGSFVPLTGNHYNVRERVLAGYLMANSKFDWGSFVGGVRVEKVTNRGRALATIPGVTGEIEAQSSTTIAFPSLHVNFDVTDEQKLRVGFTSGAARADYDQLRPNVVVNDTDGRISGGNPAVKPERAYGIDAYYEYYAQPQGYFMLGVFYKRVEDVLYTATRSFGSDVLNFGGIDRSGYQFSGITNGGKGRIFGFEAAVQVQLEPYTEQLGLPDWMGGFGITANTTYNNSKVTKPEVIVPLVTNAVPPQPFQYVVPARRVPLPGTSEVSYNLGAYYEKYGLSLRLQYQMRTTWADGFADTVAPDAGDTYWADDDELDFSARYELIKGLEVYFDASNLLNKAGRRYSDPSNILNALGVPTQRNGRYTIESEKFGRRFTGGVRFTF